MSDEVLGFAEEVGKDIARLQGRIYEGSGSPVDKIAAPVGAIYTDSAATTGAIQWIKTSGTGTTGWRVEYGDTGWRNIDAMLPTGWGGRTKITRRGTTVQIASANLRPQSTGASTLFDIPAGFRPSGDHAYGVVEDSGAFSIVRAGVFSPNDVVVFPTQVNSWLSYSITYQTSDAWSATLPGTPA